MQMNALNRLLLGRRCCSILRNSTTRNLSTKTHEEEYASRNYANNVSEYNTVIGSLTAQKRYYLLRHAYDDMMLDAVQPTRDIFYSLMLGTSKAGYIDEALYFRNEMKSMGLVPDVSLYNFLISTCGKCKSANQAVQSFEELKIFGVKPNAQTYICLLNACAAAGKLDRVYAIVRDMTAAGAGLNKFCYAGLIAAHINKIPVSEDTGSKILQLVEQSKGWSSIEVSTNPPNNMMATISDEELYNLPTASFVTRPAVLNKQLTVYHVAFHACVELKNIQVMKELLEMLKNDNHTPDSFILMQMMRCYLHTGDLHGGVKIFEDYLNSKKPFMPELYTALAEGAMSGYTLEGMKIALDALVKMNSANCFLSLKDANDLLLLAAKTKVDGYAMANFVWDLAQARKLNLASSPVQTYYKGLREFEIPEDDSRLLQVSRVYENLRFRPSQRIAQRTKIATGSPSPK